MFSLQAEREKQQEKAEWEGPFYQISCDCFFHSLNIQTGMLKLNPFIYIFVYEAFLTWIVQTFVNIHEDFSNLDKSNQILAFAVMLIFLSAPIS